MSEEKSNLFFRIYNNIKRYFDEIVLIFLSAFFFFIATNTNSGWLFFVVAFILGVLVLNFVNSILNLRKISIKRIFNSTQPEDSDIKVTIRVYNNSKIPKFFLLIEDPFPVLCPDEKIPKSLITYIPGKGYKDVCYERRAYMRGVYKFSPLKIHTLGVLGFFLITKKNFELDDKITILPRTFRKFSFPLDGVSPHISRGNRSNRAWGNSCNFSQIKEYNPGNEIRFIHWPSTARHQKFMLKEFSQITTHSLSIIIDTNENSNYGVGRETTTEHMIRKAATLVKEASKYYYHLDFYSIKDGCFCEDKNFSPIKSQIYLAQIKPNTKEKLEHYLCSMKRSSSHKSHLFIFKVLPFENLEWIENLKGKFSKITILFYNPSTFIDDNDLLWDRVKNIDYTAQRQEIKEKGISTYLSTLRSN